MKVHSRALLRISGANRVSPSGAEKKWLGLSCFLLRARLLVRLHIGSLWPGGMLHILDPDSLVLDGFRWLWCKWTGSVGCPNIEGRYGKNARINKDGIRETNHWGLHGSSIERKFKDFNRLSPRLVQLWALCSHFFKALLWIFGFESVFLLVQGRQVFTTNVLCHLFLSRQVTLDRKRRKPWKRRMPPECNQRPWEKP